ncbi:MAG: triose-phosphate isomerase [Gemmatimonadetes bacterium]|nr:triose-phosphate isomerase [Gemmatimonadota bacterium]
MAAARVVAGNWKMHHGPTATRAFLGDFRPPSGEGAPRVVIFPPALSLPAAAEVVPAGVDLGVQDIHWEDEGAFTGEISAPMAQDAGATHVLVGHSERRHVFGETDDDVRRKVEAAARHGLTPVICVGETIEERRGGRVEAVILRQLVAALEGLGSDRSSFMLAYEPVWAIGSGETATPEDASAAHATLRRRLAQSVGKPRAADVPILYGGSVKPDNAAELMAAGDVDGVLVGGASLDAAAFARIAEAGRRG